MKHRLIALLTFFTLASSYEELATAKPMQDGYDSDQLSFAQKIDALGRVKNNNIKYAILRDRKIASANGLLAQSKVIETRMLSWVQTWKTMKEILRTEAGNNVDRCFAILDKQSYAQALVMEEINGDASRLIKKLHEAADDLRNLHDIEYGVAIWQDQYNDLINRNNRMADAIDRGANELDKFVHSYFDEYNNYGAMMEAYVKTVILAKQIRIYKNLDTQIVQFFSAKRDVLPAIGALELVRSEIEKAYLEGRIYGTLAMESQAEKACVAADRAMLTYPETMSLIVSARSKANNICKDMKQMLGTVKDLSLSAQRASISNFISAKSFQLASECEKTTSARVNCDLFRYLRPMASASLSLLNEDELRLIEKTWMRAENGEFVASERNESDYEKGMKP